MNGDKSSQTCIEMFFQLIPKDMRNFSKQSVDSKDGILPYSHISDFCNGLNKSSFDHVSSPKNTDLSASMRFSDYDENKFPVPQNIGALPPEIPDVQSMEVDDLIESDSRVSEIKQNEEKIKKEKFNSPEAISSSANDNCVKTLKVQCLQSIESLEKKCEEEGLKFNACDSDEEDNKSYEVDIIYAHKVMEGDIYYLVKWKNYSTESNTWEPSWHLDGCLEMIQFYHALKKSSKQKISRNLLNYFIRDLINRKPYDVLTLTKVCALCFGASEKYVQSLQLTLSEMKTKAKQILTYSPKKLRSIEANLFHIMQYGEARKRVLINLKEWEVEINDVNLPGSAHVSVENEVDLERSPSGFEFIYDYINTVTAAPSEPVTFCSCGEDCYKDKDSCCPNDSDGTFAYNRFKRLVLEPGYPIFECNSRCKCPDTCINRVVQHGQKVKVAIFRTHKKGWGLKTLENIEKGQFVLEYLGEIITSEVAEERGRIYDYVARSYLFDLDYGVDNALCAYTVDAGHVGNVAHFINHSCDPNLHVFAVWINEQDPQLPRLAFFAKRRISKGEELTFDYKMSKDRFSEDSTAEESRILCRCNSKNCRKYLF